MLPNDIELTLIARPCEK